MGLFHISPCVGGVSSPVPYHLQLQSRRQRVSLLTVSDARRRPNRSSHQVGLAADMAVPDGRNGTEEDDDIVEVVEAFAGASDDEEVPPHLRALADAAQSGDVAALLAALDNHDGSIDVPVEDGDTLLHLACLYGHLPCVQLLLEHGASLECKDEEGAIPLHDACAGGFTEIVQYILNFSANRDGCIARMLDTVDSEGDTPLHHAARGEHLDVVKLLLQAGACPKKENSYGQTPADMADQDTEVRKLLTAKQIEASTHMSDN